MFVRLGLENKTALVTGASQNIGLSIARALAEEGVNLILISRSLEKLKSATNTMDSSIGRHLCIELDLENPKSVSILKRRLDFEMRSPDIIVHNLGGSLGISNPNADVTDWMRVWNFNLGIAIELNRTFLPDMLSRKWGRILHLSTLSTSTYLGYAPYVSAKCALEGYIKAISRLVSRDNVVINAIAPGLVALKGRFYSNLRDNDPALFERYCQEHLPIGRMVEPDEVAKVACFLCSEHAAFMPGAVVRVDGGGH
jgi:3-oxoacyl-[acyl-carrier protein] reductase